MFCHSEKSYEHEFEKSERFAPPSFKWVKSFTEKCLNPYLNFSQMILHYIDIRNLSREPLYCNFPRLPQNPPFFSWSKKEQLDTPNCT